MDSMDNAALIQAAETHCLATSLAGFVCTEAPNHDGWHRAEEQTADPDSYLYDTWPQEELHA